VRERIIDGQRWIAERLKFLRERLSADVSDDERRAIEAEIGALLNEGGIMPGGSRFRGLFRRLRRRR
jgi:hypothetical protein